MQCHIFFYSVLPCDIDDGEDVVENQVEAEGHQRLQVQEHKQHTPADQSAIRYARIISAPQIKV